MHQFRWPVAGEDAEEQVEEAGLGWKEDARRDSTEKWSPSKLFTCHVSSDLAWYPLFLCSYLHFLSSPLTLSCDTVLLPLGPMDTAQWHPSPSPQLQHSLQMRFFTVVCPRARGYGFSSLSTVCLCLCSALCKALDQNWRRQSQPLSFSVAITI